MTMNENIEKVNVGYVKERFSAYVTQAEKGKSILVCRRNRPVAALVPASGSFVPNKTKLGSARGSVKVRDDLTEPAIPKGDWNP
jgi:antitoxin (DNA-binding transcriptional repressor) of toxin-antitoxin stability system